VTTWTLIRDLRDGHPALEFGSVRVWLKDGVLMMAGAIDFNLPELPEPLLDRLKLAHAEWERERAALLATLRVAVKDAEARNGGGK
jgi:hypothetical protein